MYQSIVVLLQLMGILLLGVLAYRVIKLEGHVRRFNSLMCFKLSKELEAIDEQLLHEEREVC